MANNKVGEAYVEVRADTARLRKGLQTAEQQTERSASKMGGAFGRVGSGVDKATEGVRKFSGAITGAVGAVTGIVGVIASLIAILISLAQKFKAAREEALKFDQNFASASKTIKEFGLQELTSRLGPFEQRIRGARQEADRLVESLGELRSSEGISESQYIKGLQEIGRSLRRNIALIEEERDKQNALDDQRAKRASEYMAMRGDLWRLERDIDKFNREADEDQKRRDEARARRDAEAAERLRRETQTLQERVRLLDEIARKQREINSLGLSGSAGNIGAAVNTVGAPRVRKGP